MCRRSHLNMEHTTICSFAIFSRKKRYQIQYYFLWFAKNGAQCCPHGCMAFCSVLFMSVLCICHELTTSQMINGLPQTQTVFPVSSFDNQKYIAHSIHSMRTIKQEQSIGNAVANKWNYWAVWALYLIYQSINSILWNLRFFEGFFCSHKVLRDLPKLKQSLHNPQIHIHSNQFNGPNKIEFTFHSHLHRIYSIPNTYSEYINHKAVNKNRSLIKWKWQ